MGGGQRFEIVPIRDLADSTIFVILIGVAGLAAAYALASVGHRVRVFESSSGAIASTASGFRMTPNGSKILEQWGIWDEFEKRGCKTRSCEFLDRKQRSTLSMLFSARMIMRI